MEKDAMKRMIAARATLVLDEPFWGTLALRLRLVEDPSCDTAWVDGRTLGFNPKFVCALPTFAQTIGLLAHEVCHCVLGHPWRRESREAGRWNEACDRALNPMLRDASFHLPEGALLELDPSHRGKSAEWIFNRLPQPVENDCNSCGGTGSGEQSEDGTGAAKDCTACDGSGKQPSDTPPVPGEVRDAPPSESDEDAAATEDDWRQGVQQAAALAAGQGKLPATLARVVEHVAEARVDWRSVLRRFAQETAQADYSWAQPNRRYMAQGLFLPSLHSREMGPLVIGVDTSGSIDQKLLEIFAAEAKAVIEELQPRRVHVMYCDTVVQKQEVFERGDTITIEASGGGGTDFRPVFKALEDLEEPPVCLIYLTDLRGTFPAEDPGLPVMWVTTHWNKNTVAPFGEVVTIDE